MNTRIISRTGARIPVRCLHKKECTTHNHQKTDKGKEPLHREGTIGRLISLRVSELPGGRHLPQASRIYDAPQQHGNNHQNEQN